MRPAIAFSLVAFLLFGCGQISDKPVNGKRAEVKNDRKQVMPEGSIMIYVVDNGNRRELVDLPVAIPENLLITESDNKIARLAKLEQANDLLKNKEFLVQIVFDYDPALSRIHGGDIISYKLPVFKMRGKWVMYEARISLGLSLMMNNMVVGYNLMGYVRDELNINDAKIELLNMLKERCIIQLEGDTEFRLEDGYIDIRMSNTKISKVFKK